MLLEIILEPPGPEADAVFREWLVNSGLQLAIGGQVEVGSDQCMDVLVELRSRCYDQDLTVNVKYTGQEDLLHGSN